jgi:hypothetical protein
LNSHHILTKTSGPVTHKMFTNAAPEVMQKLLLGLGYTVEVNKLSF